MLGILKINKNRTIRLESSTQRLTWKASLVRRVFSFAQIEMLTQALLVTCCNTDYGNDEIGDLYVHRKFLVCDVSQKVTSITVVMAVAMGFS